MDGNEQEGWHFLVGGDLFLDVAPSGIRHGYTESTVDSTDDRQ
jgi:hypothetical protein